MLRLPKNPVDFWIAGWCGLVGATLPAACCIAQAQKDQAVSVLERVTISATSASALDLAPIDASPHVTVITRAEIALGGYASVNDVLAAQAGVMVDRGARSGGYGSLYLRGADPSHVVILIDHVRQNDPLSSRGSAVDLNTLTLEDVERIEIVRGNVSVVQGEALAGLIHITTRRSSKPGASVNAQMGGDGLRKLSATVGSAEFRASATHSEDGGANTGASRGRALNFGWSPTLSTVRSGISVQLRVADADNRAFPDDSGGERLAVRRTLETRSADTAQMSARSWLQLGGAGKVDVLGSFFSRDGHDENPGIAPGVRDPAGFPPVTSDTRYRRQQLQALWCPVLGDLFQFVAGTEFQRETGSFDSIIRYGPRNIPARFEITRETTSVFSEARYQLDSWTVQAGLRFQRSRGYSDAPQPSASIQRSLGDSLGLVGASVSSATKLPSFYALGHPLIGNAALRPEGGRQREIFYANAPNALITTRLTAFSARYSNLVDFDAGPPPRLINRSHINADGFEWSASHRTGTGLRGQLDGSWTRVTDPDGVTTLRARPRLQVGGQIMIPFSEQGQAALLAHYVGRRLDSAIPTGDRWLPGYTMINFVASRHVMKGLRATLALDNVLNRRVDETIGTPLGGRRLRIALSWTNWTL